MVDEHFVYCSQCGFYPGDYSTSLGITVEDHAINLADLHSSNKGHETFVIPDTWMTDSSDKKNPLTKYSTGIHGHDTDLSTEIHDTRI